MYSKCDLSREGDLKFIEDCKNQGISEELARDVISVLSYNNITLFKYDLAEILHNYYLIGESELNKPNVKLCCASVELYKIVEYAIDLVVEEIEYELKVNTLLTTNEGIESESALYYCGGHLDRMSKEYLMYIKNNLNGEVLDNLLAKSIYYKNLVAIALTDYSK